MFRLGRIEDKDRIKQMFDWAREKFKIQGTFQWGDDYPTEREFLKDLEKDIVYVWVDDITNEVTGVVTIMYTVDINYNKIEGAWLNDRPYASIHRICVAKGYENQEIGQKLYEKCEERIRQDNIVKDIKVDTYYLNKSMTRLIEKNGFVKCGKIYLLRDNVFDKERIAYQKVLD